MRQVALRLLLHLRLSRVTLCHTSSSSQMATLLELSHELLHCIFTEITPTDLSAVGRTCKDLNSYISGNKLLHKDIYLQRYDQPASETSWESEVHDLVKLEKVLESSDRQVKRDALEFAAEQINRVFKQSIRASRWRRPSSCRHRRATAGVGEATLHVWRPDRRDPFTLVFHNMAAKC